MIFRLLLANAAGFFAAFSLAGCGSVESGETRVKEPASVAEGLGFPSREPERLDVTNHYGPLVVREGDFENRRFRPAWSGYWFPRNNTYLFEPRNGRLSPLQKYDLYVERTRGRASSAAAKEAEDHRTHGVGAYPWEGRCDAWAAAAVLEPEPARGVTLQGIDFSVGDLKSLAVLSYERVDGIREFGQRFNGVADSDHRDMYPDQFHRFFQVELFEKGKSFVMDFDPGVPVWNVPIFRVATSLRRDPADRRIMRVKTTVTFAKYLGQDTPRALYPLPEGFAGELPFDFAGSIFDNIDYTYDLFGTERPDGSLLVEYGVWTGSSKQKHPDVVVALPDVPSRRSFNPELRPEIVDEILAGSRR
jgi:hypothetical protein